MNNGRSRRNQQEGLGRKVGDVEAHDETEYSESAEHYGQKSQHYSRQLETEHQEPLLRRSWFNMTAKRREGTGGGIKPSGAAIIAASNSKHKRMISRPTMLSAARESKRGAVVGPKIVIRRSTAKNHARRRQSRPNFLSQTNH